MNETEGAADSFFDSVPELSLELALLLNEACKRFEAEWRAGGRPDIYAALLELPESLRPVALCELIHLEVYYRRKLGESPIWISYAQRFPELDPNWLARAVAVDSAGSVSGGCERRALELAKLKAESAGWP